MAAYGWGKSSSVKEGLFSEGHTFDFYQAVGLLESLYAEFVRQAGATGRETEPVRFRSKVGFEFPPADIEEIGPSQASGEPRSGLGATCQWPPVMTVNFLGLAGASGPLPRHLTELIIERRASRDSSLQDFLDIFNHRLVSLLYQGRKKYRRWLHRGLPHEGRGARVAYALMGLGTEGLMGRMRVPDRALTSYAGLLSRSSRRSMVGLGVMLEDYFAIPAVVEPFVGRWYHLEEEQLVRLGRPGASQRLGVEATLGPRVWDQGAGFELRLGPAGLGKFLEFLPNGRAHESLCALTQFYAGTEFFYRVRLVLEADEVPELRLGEAARLGWTSWLKAEAFHQDDSQVTLRVDPSADAGASVQAAT